MLIEGGQQQRVRGAQLCVQVTRPQVERIFVGTEAWSNAKQSCVLDASREGFRLPHANGIRDDVLTREQAKLMYRTNKQ